MQALDVPIQLPRSHEHPPGATVSLFRTGKIAEASNRTKDHFGGSGTMQEESFKERWVIGAGSKTVVSSRAQQPVETQISRRTQRNKEGAKLNGMSTVDCAFDFTHNFLTLLPSPPDPLSPKRGEEEEKLSFSCKLHTSVIFKWIEMWLMTRTVPRARSRNRPWYLVYGVLGRKKNRTMASVVWETAPLLLVQKRVAIRRIALCEDADLTDRGQRKI